MSKERTIRVFTLDTETRGLEGDIFLAGLYDGECYYESENVQDLLAIIDQDVKRGAEVHVYCHNLNFDLLKFAHHIITQNGVNLNDSIFINNSVVTFFCAGVAYHDSYKLLPSSLERLSKSFGLSDDVGKINLDDYIAEQGYKDKEDFFKRVPPTDPVLCAYLKNDCRALYTILETTAELAGLPWEKFVRCPTVASLAMQVYQSLFPEDYKEAISTNYYAEGGVEAEAFARESYHGGRTEVFVPFVERAFHYDVNSLYPHVMKANTFPVGFFQHMKGTVAEIAFSRWRRNRIGGGMVRATVHIPEDMWIPPLPVKRHDKLMFPVGTLKDVWVFEELENALRYGVELIEVHEVVFFTRRSPIFYEFVSKFEKLKNESEGALREFAKNMLNNLYGKFGMSRERDSFFPIEKLDELRAEGKEAILLRHHYYEFDFVQSVTYSRARYIQPHIASYVTAYARILLYNAIHAQIQKGFVAYCDTDSIVTDTELPPDLVDENAFGKWKLEKTLQEGIFVQPKFYYERGTNEKGKDVEIKKAKGVPKSILEKFERDLYVDILQKRVEGAEEYPLYEGVKQVPKFGSVLKQDLPPETIFFIRKSLNLLSMEKRDMDYVNNTSKPHYLNDLEVTDYDEHESTT